ncbi:MULTISPECIES: hypothetical protein [unclassified Sporosarcina]|uniref:hypothetical protein n=1 Tax=unclassified Sporosarcina TaxID=2647733 RepID=UPI00203C6503|nr:MULTISPECIES: hypothetical protein [unclassified Sporosarcina]GKV65118.1 hypothetical protein NCCP2331_12710 [Sporosarcina sp. NCCP-2331]GLB55242.1 hypothetical protein NCCP2378_10280 [Sporosarcina sp. NCCP-2378]
MQCFCEEEVFYLKVEGDTGADAVWCDECGSNLDIADVPASDELKFELTGWVRMYGNWMDWEQDLLLAGGVENEEAHNEQGEILARRLQEELTGYRVRFSPSSSAKMYAGFIS